MGDLPISILHKNHCRYFTIVMSNIFVQYQNCVIRQSKGNCNLILLVTIRKLCSQYFEWVSHSWIVYLYLHTLLNFITMHGHLENLEIVHDYMAKMARPRAFITILFYMNALKNSYHHRKLNEFLLQVRL